MLGITPDGKADCLVTLKNGDQKAFRDNELMWPYYKAWLRRKEAHRLAARPTLPRANYRQLHERRRKSANSPSQGAAILPASTTAAAPRHYALQWRWPSFVQPAERAASLWSRRCRGDCAAAWRNAECTIRGVGPLYAKNLWRRCHSGVVTISVLWRCCLASSNRI